MGDYRCYLLDGAGAIRAVELVDDETDASALAQAQQILSRRPEFFGFELWQRNRRVYVEALALP